MPGSSRAGQAGAALILVLWTFTVLSALAAEFARAMREEAQSTRNFKEETIAHYIALAGINEAILAVDLYNGELQVDDEENEELDGRGRRPGDDDEEKSERVRVVETLLQGRGDWVEARFNGIVYEVRVIDETGKIPINAPTVDEELLRRIMENLGYDEEIVATVSDSILDWRDEDDLHRTDGAEDDYYEGLRRPYHSKDAPFSAIEELLLVRGVTPDIYHGRGDTPGLKEIFTAISRTRYITISAISPEVELALCGTTGEEEDEPTGLGAESVTPENDLASCVATTQLGSRDRARPALGTATVEARVKGQDDRVLTHIGMAVHFSRGGGDFRTLQWYDAIYSDEG